MIIGIPRERAADEKRVGLSPRGVRNLVERGHTVVVEKGAGAGSGFADDQYEQSGGLIVHEPGEVFARAELVTKIHPPAAAELAWLQPDQVVLGFLHLAVARPDVIGALVERGCTAIDYVTMQDDAGNLPVLRPMSQIAGRIVSQIAARYLQSDHGGLGILLGGAPAVPPAEVVVIGAGTVGRNAVRAFLGAGAGVTLLDVDFDRICDIDWAFPGRLTTFVATEASLRKALQYADVVVGAILVPGARTPHLVSKEMIGLMRERSLIVDISIDQGGCFETSRPTRLSDPTYVVDGITHYCVPNLPSLVARSATYALGNIALPYIAALARGPVPVILRGDGTLARGVNVYRGRVTHPRVAEAHGIEHHPLADLLAD
ncbi:MAG: alanine dehydrogenase [Candidatus Krumholzibacteriia bacterium]